MLPFAPRSVVNRAVFYQDIEVVRLSIFDAPVTAATARILNKKMDFIAAIEETAANDCDLIPGQRTACSERQSNGCPLTLGHISHICGNWKHKPKPHRAGHGENRSREIPGDNR